MTGIEAEALAGFTRDTTAHQMTVLRDDGMYRHLRYAPPGSSPARCCWFELVTWPGHLAVDGGMGAFTFARPGGDEDLFPFFRQPQINPMYWVQKVRAGQGTREYSETVFRQAVFGYFSHAARHEGTPKGLGRAIRTEILEDGDIWYEEGARHALDQFEYQEPGTDPGLEPWRFSDVWEWDLRDWSYHYLWCCHAIRRGVELYDAARCEATERAVAGQVTA